MDVVLSNPFAFHITQSRCRWWIPASSGSGSGSVSRSRSGSRSGESAHHVLDEFPLPADTFAWNNLIRIHLATEDPSRALSTYQRMLLLGGSPDKHTLPRILTATRLSNALRFGEQVHAQVLKLGLLSDDYVLSALMDMYGGLQGAHAAEYLFRKCESHGRRRRRSPVSWTLLAKLYILEDKPRQAVQLFHQMLDCFGAETVDPVALATAARACGLLRSLQEGRRVHEVARKCGLEFNILVSNSLLKMYADCGSVEDARSVFDQMPLKDGISWTAIIRGYVKTGEFNEGLKLCRQMTADSNIKLDSLTISSILPACARMAAHKNGKEIHAYLLRNGIDFNLTVQNAVLDMYIKSGCMDSATRFFTQMKVTDAISWTVMILGYSLHGQGELGVRLFHKMHSTLSSCIDETAYAAVLHACHTAGMVKEGRFYFNCIRAPQLSHCVLMVSILARAALFEEAKVFMDKRRIRRHPEILRALLNGCRIHCNFRLGKQMVEQLCDMEPLQAENYVMLSNCYAENGKWDMVHELTQTIRDMDLKPKKAHSWIEFKNKVHVFGTGDISHPRSERIYWELKCLTRQIEDEGNWPRFGFALHDVHEERECILYGHSEMLAISFGLISTESTSTIRLTKNLRICQNCHHLAKAISKIVDRKIVIKDPNCFHHFKNGCCSCRDIW